ncbi:MFS family permease [Oxalobacteraceae bacterium GrIS 1.11]
MAQSKKEQSNSKLLVLGAVCLSGVAMPLSFTGPAVAMPAIAIDLGGSPIALNWITNAFMLSFGSILMAAGAMADNYGRKRMFLIGISSFALTSLALVFSPNILCLDILRALQGAASAMTLSSGAATLAQEFDDHARTRAFSVLGTTFGVGLAFGPILAGYMTEHFGWRSIFLGVALSSLIASGAGMLCIRESRDPDAGSLDCSGAVSFTAALTLFTCGVLRAPENGWASPVVLSLLAGSSILLSIFVWFEMHVARPMLDLSLFRYPRFIGVQFLAAAPAYCYVVLLVLMPMRLIGIEGYRPLQAGQMMIALSAPMLIFPMIAGLLTRWFSAALISGLGLLVAAAGLVWLAQCAPGLPANALVLPMLTIGLGVSFPWGLMDGLAVSVVPKERAGMATGIFNTTRVAGEGIALAIAGAILNALLQSNLAGMLKDDRLASSPLLFEAAQRLALGDIPRTLALLPQTNRMVLLQSYGDGFHVLLYILAAITITAAAMVFGFLSRQEASGTENAKDISMVPAIIQ